MSLRIDWRRVRGKRVKVKGGGSARRGAVGKREKREIKQNRRTGLKMGMEEKKGFRVGDVCSRNIMKV